MHGSAVVSWADSIIGSAALVALIFIALGTIVGMVKPADACKYIGVTVGFVIVLVLLVSVLVGLWSTMSLWQRAFIAGIVFVFWRMRRERHAPRREKRDD